MARHRINAERSAWEGVWEVGRRHPIRSMNGVAGIIVSPCRQSSAKLSPCLVSKEGSPPALRPLHAPVHGSNTGAQNNLDHNSLLPHPTTSPGPSGCTPRYVDPPPGPGNGESIVPAPCPRRASARRKPRRRATYVRRERGGGVTHPRIFVNRASR